VSLSARRDEGSDALDFIVSLSAFLTSERDDRSLLPDVLKMVLRTLQLQHVIFYISRIRGSSEYLVLSHFESADQQGCLRYEMEFGHGISGKVASGTGVLESDCGKREELNEEPELQAFLIGRSFSAHPLIGGERVLGVIFFVETDLCGRNSRELYRVIANILSSYMLRIDARFDSSRSKRKFTLLNSYRRAFSGSFELKSGLSLFMNLTAGIFGAEAGICTLFDRDMKFPWVEINRGISYADILSMTDSSGLALPEKVQSVRTVLRGASEPGGEPLFILQEGRGGVIHSFIAGGLYSKDRMIGFLLLANKSSDPLDNSGSFFIQDDEELFEIVLEQARVFVENYLLYGKVMEVNALNQKILESIDSGVVTLDLGGRISSCNSRFLEMLHFEKESLTGRHIHTVFDIPDLELEVFSDNKQEMIQVHRDFEYERNGVKRVLSLMISPMKTESGQSSGYVMTVLDRTEHFIMERQIRRTDKLAALGELSAGLAHEIKNPLTAIKGFAQLLPKRFGDEQFLHKFSSMLNNELMRIDELTERLLTFARPNVGGMREIAIQDLIEDAVLLAKYQLEKAGIRYIVKGCEPPPRVVGSPGRLSQVFLNIIINGLHAMHKGGFLTVRIFRSMYLIPDTGTVPAVVIDFVDTGVGIEEGRIDSIFNPFFTTKESGTGLGLSISYRIIEEHGGVIEVKSSKGAGTRMRIALPEVEQLDET